MIGITFEFDAKNNVLRVAVDGQVTDSVLLDFYGLASDYTASHPPCRGLWDFSGVTSFDVSSGTMRQLARSSPLTPPGYISVLVAPGDFLFGMARMFQILGEKTRPELHVVHTMEEAYRLLGVKNLEFRSIRPPER